MANDSIAVEDIELASPTVPAASDPERVHTRRAAFERRWLGGINVAYLVLVAALLLFPLVSPGSYAVSLLTQILVFSIFTMSLDLLLGYVGLPSFGHAAFLGLGAYAAAILSAKMGISNLGIAFLAGAAVASVGAVILGVLAL